jgi:hypothetical protein
VHPQTGQRGGTHTINTLNSNPASMRQLERPCMVVLMVPCGRACCVCVCVARVVRCAREKRGHETVAARPTISDLLLRQTIFPRSSFEIFATLHYFRHSHFTRPLLLQHGSGSGQGELPTWEGKEIKATKAAAIDSPALGAVCASHATLSERPVFSAHASANEGGRFI